MSADYTVPVVPSPLTRLHDFSDQMKQRRELWGWVGVGTGALELYAGSSLDASSSQKSFLTTVGIISLGTGVISFLMRTDAENAYKNLQLLSPVDRELGAERAMKEMANSGFSTRMITSAFCVGYGLFKSGTTDDDNTIKALWVAAGIAGFLFPTPAESVYNQYQLDIKRAAKPGEFVASIDNQDMRLAYRMTF